MKLDKYIIFSLLCLLTVFPIGLTGCNSDDDVRKPEDIMGVWSPDENFFMEFSTNNEVHTLTIDYQNGQSIGIWDTNVYYYEPGYNLVIYLNSSFQAIVYEIVTLNSRSLTWCPVDEISQEDAHDIGKVIGDIINKAQEGYKLNPELYETFSRVSDDEFYDIIQSLDIEY